MTCTKVYRLPPHNVRTLMPQEVQVIEARNTLNSPVVMKLSQANPADTTLGSCSTDNLLPLSTFGGN